MSTAIKYYDDTSIPLGRFIDATVDYDLKALLKEPLERDLTEEETALLGQALLKINSDYLQVLEDASISAYTQRMQQMAYLGLRILRMKLAVESLRIVPTLRMIEVLKGEFDYDFNPFDEEQFTQDLQNVLTELVADEIEFERMEKIEDEQQEKQQKEPPKTKQGFRNLLFEINHAEGLKYTIEDLTLADFAELIKRLKVHYRNQQLKALA